ncbi:MAG: hypothetical protein IPK60_06240 [Sandaracinaceae bacterium]|nr:hypothetical protein [Sandaracinaceae bacterium]
MHEFVVWQRWVMTGKDDAEDARVAAEAVRAFSERASAMGARPLLAAGGTCAFAFNGDDVRGVIDLLLSYLAELELSEPNLRVTFGVALGTLSAGTPPVGDAIDRAQVFAGRARPGEIVVDPETRQRAQAHFLFARLVNAGASALRGHTVDRNFPRRETCRTALTHLGELIVAPSHTPFIDRIRELAATPGSPRLLLRGPAGAGVRTWVGVLERELSPPLVLRLQSVPGGLEPLGSLRMALIERFGTRENSEERTLTRVQLDEVTQRALLRMTNGEPLPRNQALSALVALLKASQKTPTDRAWVLLDPLDALDPASIELVSDAVGPHGADALIVGRLPADMRPPASLLRGGAVEDMRVPELRFTDARAIAEALLGTATHAEIVRRTAELGGDSPLGVVTAARTLIAAGDLVWHEGGYYWRVGPRANAAPLSLRAMWHEHAHLLPTSVYRALEVVAACPEDVRLATLAKCIAQDGGNAEQALHLLQRELLLQSNDPPALVSRFLRASIVEAMPKARRAQTHSIIADVLRDETGPNASFREASLGHYFQEAGKPAEAAQALLNAGRAASKAGYARSAVRLAAAAVRADGSDAVRDATAALMIDADTYTPAPSTRPLPEQSTNPDILDVPAVHSAVQAILARDFDAVDRAVETAVAKGRDPAAADRVRAMAELARGDVAAAMRILSRARKLPEQDKKSAARAALTLSLVLLESGDKRHAVRAALGALAAARAAQDARGEEAAMRALAQCYRALGREDDARALDGVASQ